MLTRLAKDIVVYGASDFAFRLIALIVVPIYANLFSVEEFGIMALATTAASLVATIANLGLNSAVQRYYWDPNTTAEGRSIVVSTGLVVLGAASILAAGTAIIGLYPIREWIEGRYAIPWPILLLAVVAVIPEQLMQYALDVLRLQFNPIKVAVIAFLKNLAGVILGLVLVVGYGQGLTGVFIGSVIAASIAAPFALWIMRSELVAAFDPVRARRLVKFGFPLAISGVAFWMFGTLDRWMLAELSNTQQVGLYSIAAKFSLILVVISAAFSQAWSPIAIKLMRDYPDDYRSKLSRVLTMWSFGLLLVACGIALFGFEMLFLLTPEPYWRASIPLALLAAAMAASGTVQLTAIGISIARVTRLIAIGSWASALINVSLNLLLIPPYGADGAAVATLVTYLALTSAYLWWSQRLHPIPLEIYKLMFALALLLGTIVLVLALHEWQWSPMIFAFKVAVFSGILVCGLRYIVGTDEARRLFAVIWPVKA